MFGTAIMVMEAVVGSALIFRKLRQMKISKADDDEIKREDDASLKGAAFLTTALLFIVNAVFQTTILKLCFFALFILPIASFFVFRYWATIKQNAFSRFLSVFFLVWSGSSYIYMVLVIFFPAIYPPILTLPPILIIGIFSSLGIISFVPTAIVSIYYVNRYGLKRNKQ
ncbi:MAG: hypothetical protein NWF05_02320 [Candidatus Bathyarchaeota archaeon]|nr:hypothetical protein [Candidatus Bathyarchaeota archaeon]